MDVHLTDLSRPVGNEITLQSIMSDFFVDCPLRDFPRPGFAKRLLERRLI